MIKRAYILILLGAAIAFIAGVSVETTLICLFNQLMGCSILAWVMLEEKINGSMWLRRIKHSSTPTRRNDF